jgi:predicted O-methyltransferase YrrM
MAKRIEGWMSDKELEFLGIAAKNHKNILEIGCYKGKSTRVLADNAIGTVHCVDTWNSVVYSNDGRVIYKTSNDTYIDFVKNLHEHIENQKVIVHRVDYRYFEPNGHKPDFIFIDAAHDYESVKHDIAKSMWMYPKMIGGHDYDKKVWPGVVQAVDEYFDGIQINHVDTIWWVEND